MSIPILFEDSDFLVVNKPSGLPTQATVDRSRPDLFNQLREMKQWPYLALHHRLDAPTSGLVILSKNKEMNKPLQELFQKHQIQKTYLCLCQKMSEGLNQNIEFEVQNHLKVFKMPQGKSKVRSVQKDGDPAHTRFRVREQKEKFFLIEAQPLTGRMHQIRVHLSERRMPILGDALYFRADRKFPRLMLHALSLEWIHPKTKEFLKVEAPWPEDFKTSYGQLFGEVLAKEV